MDMGLLIGPSFDYVRAFKVYLMNDEFAYNQFDNSKAQAICSNDLRRCIVCQ